MSTYAGPWAAARRHAAIIAVATEARVTPAWAACRPEGDSFRVWLHSAALSDPRDDIGQWLVDPTGCDVAATVSADGSVTLDGATVIDADAPMSREAALGFVQRSAGASGRAGALEWSIEPTATGYRVSARAIKGGAPVRAWDLNATDLSVSSVKL